MSEMISFRNPSLAAATSSISRFSDAFDPFQIASKKALESVSKFRGMGRFMIRRSSSVSVTATLNMLLKALTSPAIADRTTRRALYDLNDIDTALPWTSTNRVM